MPGIMRDYADIFVIRPAFLKSKLGRRYSAWLVLTFFIVQLVGCSGNDRGLVPLKGKIQLDGAAVQILAGHSLELALEKDPKVRAFATIQTDGTFECESYFAGEIESGVTPGKYVGRIVLGDDDPDLARLAKQSISEDYLSFETSNITVEAPATGEVTVQLN